MRFSVIYLALLLLLPSLVTSKERDLSAPPPPPPAPAPAPAPSSPRPSPSYPILNQGDIVRFRGNQGLRRSRLGVVVGTRQHNGGNVNIAPSVSNSRHSSGPIEVHIDKVVNTHPGNVAMTSRTAQPRLASNLHSWHQVRPPIVDSVSGAVRGSPNHQAAQLGREMRSHPSW